MLDESAADEVRAPRWRRRVGRGLLAVLVLLVLAVVLFHTPPVEQAMGERLRATLTRRLNADVTLRDFHYNALTGTVRLSGLVLSAPGASRPFLAVDEASVDASLEAYRGNLSATKAVVTGVRVDISRDARGASNWPTTPAGGPPTWPAVLSRLGGLTVRDINVHYDDRSADVLVNTVIESFTLAPDASAASRSPAPGQSSPPNERRLSGALVFRDALDVTWAGRRTAMTVRDARAVSTPTAIGAEGMTLESPEGRMAVDVRFEPARAADRLRTVMQWDARAPALAKWFDALTPLGGDARIGVEFTVLPGPAVLAFTVQDSALSWRGVAPLAMQGGGRLTGGVIEIAGLSIRHGAGAADVTGRVGLGGKPSELHATWRDFPGAALLRTAAFPQTIAESIGAANAVGGSLEARWTAPELSALTLRLQSSWRSVPGPATPPAAIRLDGPLTIEARDRRWSAHVAQLFFGVATVEGNVGGALARSGLEDSEMRGDLTLDVPDVSRAIRALTAATGVEQPASLSNVSGSFRGPVKVIGTISDPRAHGDLDGRVAWTMCGPVTLRAGVDVDARALRATDVTIEDGDQRLRADATIVLTPRTIEGRFSSTPIALGNLTRCAAPSTIVEGFGSVTGAITGPLGAPIVTADLSADNLEVAGQSFARVTGSTAYRAGAWTFEKVVAEQSPSATGESGRLELSGRFTPATNAYTIRGQGERLAIAPLVSLATPGGPPLVKVTASNATLTFDGEGVLEKPSLNGRVHGADVIWNDKALGEVDVDARLQNDVVTLEASAPRLFAKATGRVGIRAPYRFDGRVDVDGADVSQASLFAALDPSDPLMPTGSIAGQIRAQGEIDRLRDATAEVLVKTLSVVVAHTTVTLQRPATLSYRAGVLGAADVELRVGERTTLRVDGTTATDAERVSASIAGDLIDLSAILQAAAARAGVERDVTLMGAVTAQAAIAGSPEQRTTTAELRLADAAVTFGEAPPVEKLTLLARMNPTIGLEIENIRATWQGADGAVSAQAPPAWLIAEWPSLSVLLSPPAASGPRPRASAEVRVTNLGARVLEPFFGPRISENLGFGVDAVARVDAGGLSLEDARGEVQLEKAAVWTTGVLLTQKAPTRLTIDNGVLRTEQWSWRDLGHDEDHLDVTGSIALKSPRSVDASIDGQLDLRLLTSWLPDVGAGGDAVLAAKIQGPLGAPTVDGRVTLHDGEVYISNPQLAVFGLTGDVRMSGRTVSMRGLTGLVNGGDLTLNGDLELMAGLKPEGVVQVTVRGAAFEILDGLRGEANADLNVTWPSGPNQLPVISGTATALRADYRRQFLITSGFFRQRAAAARGRTQPRAPWGLDIRATTDEDALVDNNYGRASLGGTLHVTGTTNEPGLVGDLVARPGGLLYFAGARYQIDSGVLAFNNPTAIEPSLNLVARTTIRGYDIELRLDGPIDSATPELRSDPPLAESDIASLLLFGQTQSELGEQSGEAAASLLSTAWTEYLGAAGRALGLDAVRLERDVSAADEIFDPSLVASESDPSLRLTFSKNLRSDIELIMSQDLRKSGDQTWIVSYKPLKNIEVRAVRHDNNDRSYEFRHDLTFGRALNDPQRRRTTERGAHAPRVRDVRIVGAPDALQPQLMKALKLKAGERFDFYDWQHDRDRLGEALTDAGYFEGRVVARRDPPAGASSQLSSTRQGAAVTLAADSSIDTLALEYVVRTGPKTVLDVVGAEITDKQRRAMEKEWVGSTAAPFLVKTLETMLREYLAEDGYLKADVHGSLIGDASREARRIELNATSGPLIAQRDIVVEGADRVKASEIRKILKRDLGLGALWIDPARAVDVLQGEYQSRGMLDAHVETAEPKVDGARAALTITIAEGPLYHWGAVTVEPQRTDVNAVRALHLSKTTVYTSASLEAARRRLRAAYRRAGFPQAVVDVSEAHRPETANVDAAFRVVTGPRQILEDVQLAGLARASPSIVNRAMTVKPGETLGEDALARMRSRLYDAGVFRSVAQEVDKVGGADASGDDSQPAVQPVRLRVTLVEQPVYRFRYGLQLFDPEDPLSQRVSRQLRPGVVADFSRRLVFGRSISTGVAARLNKTEQAVRGYVTAPSTVGLPIATSFFVGRTRERLTPDFRPTLTEFTAEQRFRFRKAWHTAYGYNIRRYTFDTTDISFPGSLDLGRLTGAFVIDTRNDLLDPNKGFFHSSSAEYANQALASDVNFEKFLFQQFYFFQTPGRIVLASAARLEIAQGAGLALLRTERLSAGGSTTVRGYAEGEVDLSTGLDFIGPRSQLLILNQEARIPLRGRFGAVVFFDLARVWTTLGDIRNSDLRYSTGFGLRFKVAVAPLRLDVGFPLRKDEVNRNARVYFSIGHAF